MIGFTLQLACGHSTPERHGPKLPPYLDPTETAWSLAWCGDCQTQQKVTDVRHSDGPKCPECNGRGVVVDPWATDEPQPFPCPTCTQSDGEEVGNGH